MLAKNDAVDQVSQAVLATIADLMEEQGIEHERIDQSAKLVDTLGLKSMDIAQIVLVLEDELDADPFQEIPITSVRTVGDLINAYQVTLNPELAPDASASAETSASPTSNSTGTARRANRRR